MLVPKIFRWIFFRKQVVTTAFDAVRNNDTIFIDTSLKLNKNQATFKGSIHLNSSNIEAFIAQTPKDKVLVLFGNNQPNSIKLHDVLEGKGFKQVFNVGTLKDLKEIKGD